MGDPTFEPELVEMERTTYQSVTFFRPFRLAGVEGVQPPGSFDVETVEQRLDKLSFSAFLRISTTITLVNSWNGARQVHAIDPDDLASALKLDKEGCKASLPDPA